MTETRTIHSVQSATKVLVMMVCVGGLAGCAGMATGTSSVNPERKSEVITMDGYSFEIITESYEDDLLKETNPTNATIRTRTVITPDGQRQKCGSRAECVRIGEASIANAPPIPAAVPTAEGGGGGAGGGGGEG